MPDQQFKRYIPSKKERLLQFFQTSDDAIEKLDKPKKWFILSMLLFSAAVICLFFAPTLSFILFICTAFCLSYGALMLGRHQMANHFILLGQCLDNSPQGVLITNPEGRSLWCNRAFRHLLPGVVPLDITKGHILEGLSLWLANSEDIEAVYRMLQLAATGFEDRMTIMVRSPDGSAESYYLFVSPVDGQDALLWQVTSHKEDGAALSSAIYEAREAALNEWQQQDSGTSTHKAIETEIIKDMPCGWFAMDENGVVQSVNEGFLKIVGVKKEQILKGDFHLSDHIIAAEPMKYSPVMSLLQDRETQGMNGIIHIRRGENGQSLKAWLYQSAQYDKKGRFQTTNSVIIPEPEAVEKPAAPVPMASQTENTSSHIPVQFNDIPLPMVWIDARRNIKKVSHAFFELMDRGEAELIGLPFSRLFPPSEAERLQTFLYRVSSGARSLTIEGLKGGSSNDSLSIRLYAVKADTNDPNEILLVAEDISDSHALRSKMSEVEKDRLIGQVAGKVIHDFKNSLAVITGGAESVLEQLQPEDAIYPRMYDILNSAQKAANLSKWLNRMNRASTGDRNWHDANELLRESHMAIKAALGAKNELQTQYCNETAGLFIDTIAFDQVLMNLVSNARDAMPKGGQLFISIEKKVLNQPLARFPDEITPGLWVVVKVADTGTGIPEHVLKRIFEKRFTTKKAGEGTGLGLDSVRQTVRSQDGYVAVETMPNQGSVFEIWFPFVEGDNNRQPVQKKHIPVDLSGEGKILVVEDEDRARGYTVRALRQRGYEVFEALDGQEGLELIMQQQGELDLIISDISMPRLDGPSMIAYSRQKYPHIPVLIVSGNSGEDLDRDLSKIGDVPFLAKPYTLEGLVLKVKSILSEKQKENQQASPQEPAADLFSHLVSEAPKPPKAKAKTMFDFAYEEAMRVRNLSENSENSKKMEKPITPPSPSAVTQAPPKSAATPKRKPLIILADDEAMARMLIAQKLSKSGFEVFEVEDGTEGLQTALEHLSVLDLVITDLNMIQMNGDEMAEKIWQEKPDIPIIFLSGDISPLKDKIKSPYAAFMEKPALPSKVLDKVEEILQV